MRELTEKDQEKLLVAGEICYKEMLQDIEQITTDDIPISYDREKLRQAEAEAWQEVYRNERRTKYKHIAILVACLIIALVTVMLTGKPSVAYQKFWNNLFVKDNGNSMSIVSSSTALLPEDWSGYYVPMEIPPGYVIENTEKYELYQLIFYINPDGNYIDFSVGLGDFNVHLDTEDCIVENIIVNNKDGMLRTKYKNNEIAYISISWVDNNMFFSLNADNLSCETLLSIAESIMIAE